MITCDVAFGGILSEYDSFSNWAPAEFVYEGFSYKVLEQGYMRIKAIENNDMVAERMLRYVTDPRLVKKIGSAIKITDKERWDNMKGDVMLKLVRAKFTQNEGMKKELIETGSKRIGESGKDQFYAVGLPFTHPRSLDTRAWTGKSMLGNSLQTVRAEFTE